ncbi:peptidoglycan DD-metalloendopeptidase family protein [Bathymodiolus heckerae thiotrophic gill symbiont]|uniref:peptidoglycan DD-metalloendopeptidase family protein n=1 Tax=Bathymodiolus heckerae thiotrophic gill symbiont TaxID=1052212 RepID=UPI001FCF0B8F|nr:peptidoglycan DD-metalloendopeptidase family protein [Bathymodiolus heckerae thiotrophic gill symbiont]
MKIISLFLLLFSNVILANITVENTSVPGGVAVIDFESNHSNPKAFYRTVPLYVQHIKDRHWQVLVGIPLLEKLGKKSITVQGLSTQTLNFEVKKHNYTEQHITLKGKNKKYVNPNLAHMKRINQERPILSKARTVFSDKTLSNGLFSRPVDGITTSPFGLKRFYNGQARRPHTGLDYAGGIGTLIKAPADGKVILIGEYFFNGKAIFLDHGQGLISVYIHLNKHLVKQGQSVKQGEVIGKIGQSGRATGPHLHWGVYLNRTAINPNLFLDEQGL